MHDQKKKKHKITVCLPVYQFHKTQDRKRSPKKQILQGETRKKKKSDPKKKKERKRKDVHESVSGYTIKAKRVTDQLAS